MDSEATQPRAGQLDGIRAICVIAVVFSHTIPETYRIGDYLFFEFGAYSVFMFFVLSGYLITGQLLVTQEKRRSWHDTAATPLMLFYAKRVLRLFPAYYVAIIGAALMNIQGMRDEFWWHATQLSDLLFAFYPDIEDMSAAGHFWSLTVEWQFYLVWPMLILLAPARALPWLIALVLAVSAYSWAPMFDLNPVLERTNILQSLDSLAFGAGLAYAEYRRWSLGWLERAAWPAALLIVCGIGLYMTGHVRTAQAIAMSAHEAMNLLFAAIVYRAAKGTRGVLGRTLELAPLRYIGVISYGIYVYHQFAIAVVEKIYGRLGWGELNWGVVLGIEIFAISAIAAALSWRYMEQPINGLRHRFAYRRPAFAIGDRPTIISADPPEATPPVPSVR